LLKTLLQTTCCTYCRQNFC